MTPAESSDTLRTFNSACLSQAPACYCEALEQNTLTNGSPFQEFSTHDFMVLDYPIDAGTLFLKMYSPRHTAALSYCYFVSRGSIDPKKAELKKDIPEYNWENQKVAVREYLAFTYEDDPSLLPDKTKSCIL